LIASRSVTKRLLTGVCGACACPASAADDQEAFELVVPRVGLVGSAVVLGPHHKDYLGSLPGAVIAYI
jgi:hypothetical protein